jgi:iron complex transport system substrate-binding protein
MSASTNRPSIAAHLIGALALACLVASATSAQTRVSDATGRAIVVPEKIDRVYAAGPPASVLLLALAPDKLIGWTRSPRPGEAAFLPESLAALPELGRLTGRGNTANVEVVMAAKPDLIVDVGSTAATFVTLAERVQQQTGVPYLLFDGSLRDTPRLLREVGRAIGKAEAAEVLAADAASQIREVTTRVAGVPDRERPRVYFARGPSGLTTAPRGSMQAEALELAGGFNVIAPPPAFEGNLVNVSLEDVLLAGPEIIVASDPAFAADVRSSPAWKDVRAVRDGRVYVVPGVPFGWFDSPPSLNRLLGMHWLARVFYPKLFPEPLGPRIKAFHRAYYHREPTDEQVRALLSTAGLSE